MSLLILPVMCLVLSGCVYQSASQVDIEKAVYACGSIDNIEYISIQFTGNEGVMCNDGTYLFLAEVKLPRKGEVK